MSEFSPDQKPVRGEDDLWPLARRIAQKTMEVWETHVRKGQAALVESHQESLPKLARAGLTYGEQSISTYLTSRMNEDNPTLRLAATRALGQIATNDMTAVETLLDQLDDEAPSMRHEAAMALGEIGTSDQEIIERLTTGIENGPPKMRHGAAVALGWIDVGEPAVIEVLVNCLDDEDASVRTAAAQALGRMDFDEQSVIQDLVDQLAHQYVFEDPSVKQMNAQVLGWIGSSDSAVIEALVRRLKKGGSEAIQRAAVEAISRGDRSDQHIRDRLHDWFGDWPSPHSSQSVQDAAWRAFFDKEVETDSELAEEIATRIEEDRLAVRQAAAEALGRIGRKDPEVTRALVDQLRDEDFMVRSEAAKALGRIGAGSSTVIGALINRINDRAYVRKTVVESLGRVGTDSSAAAEALIKRLSDENPKVRRAAIKALGRISPDEPRATEALATELGEGSSEDRTLAAEALSRLGVLRPDVFRHLVGQVVGQDENGNRRAAQVLADLHWRVINGGSVDETRPDLSEVALPESDRPAVVLSEDGEHVVVHWQVLAQLPE